MTFNRHERTAKSVSVLPIRLFNMLCLVLHSKLLATKNFHVMYLQR